MAEKVKVCKINKEHGYLYYLDRSCNILRFQLGHAETTNGEEELVLKNDIQCEDGYMYFIDSKGDISRLNLREQRFNPN